MIGVRGLHAEAGANLEQLEFGTPIALVTTVRADVWEKCHDKTFVGGFMKNFCNGRKRKV